MPDLAELELRIKSVEAQLATSRLQALSEAARRAETGSKTLTSRFQELARGAALGTQNTFGFVRSLQTLAVVLVARKAGQTLLGTIGSVEQLRDLSIQIGGTVKDIQELKFAAGQSGTSIEALAQGITIATANLEEFQLTGKGPGSGIIKALGTDFVDAAKEATSFIDLLPILNQKFLELSKGEQIIVARKLFGRGGPALIQLLTSDLGKLRGEFDKFGKGIDDDAAESIDKVSDSVKKLEESWLGLKVTIVDKIAPLLTDTFTELARVINNLGKPTGGFWDTMGKGFDDMDRGLNQLRVDRAIGEVERLKAAIEKLTVDPETSWLEGGPRWAEDLAKLNAELTTQQEIIDHLSGTTGTWTQETIDLANAMGKAAEERRKLGLPTDFVGPLPQSPVGGGAGDTGILKRAADLEKSAAAEEGAMEGLEEMRLGLESERAALSALSEDRELAITLLDIERLAKEGGTAATRKRADELRKEAIATNDARKALAQLEQAAEENKQRIAGAVDTISGSFANFATDAVFEIKSVEDAFEDLVKGLSQQALNNVLKQAVGSLLGSALGTSGGGSGSQLGSIIGSLFSSEVQQARGNIFRGGNELVQFERGGFPSGITSSPTYFPMSRGRMGVMSERGQEEWAIAPLSRTPSGKLGVDVRTSDGGRRSQLQPLILNQYIETKDADSFRRSKRQLAADARRVFGGGR